MATSLTDEEQVAGAHRLRRDGKDKSGQPVPSGVYIYLIVLQSLDGGRGHFTEEKKMIVLR